MMGDYENRLSQKHLKVRLHLKWEMGEMGKIGLAVCALRNIGQGERHMERPNKMSIERPIVK